MSDPQDYWKADNFEYMVANTLIACFETNIKKNKRVASHDRITEKHVRLFRNVGPYVASTSRAYIVPEEDGRIIAGYFDIDNDPLPNIGCLSFKYDTPDDHPKPDRAFVGELFNILVKKVKAPGKGWYRRGDGQMYAMYLIVMNHNKNVLSGERRYFTVGRDGVISCEQIISIKGRKGNRSVIGQHRSEHEILRQTNEQASLALQLLADRRFSWVITAQEENAKVHLGCMQEEIKSLLYARDLPLTATGRKRPILHVIASHKRRMKSGTEIDIRSFLKGTQKISIGSTEFTVRPPKVSLDKFPTSKRYFER